jgi:hypothetical protein
LFPSEKSSNGSRPQFELTDESRAILKRSCPNLLGPAHTDRSNKSEEAAIDTTRNVVQVFPDNLHPQQLLKDFTLLKTESIYVAFLYSVPVAGCQEELPKVGIGQVRASTLTARTSWILQKVMILVQDSDTMTTCYEEEQIQSWRLVPILMELIVVVGLQFVESESDVHVLWCSFYYSFC